MVLKHPLYVELFTVLCHDEYCFHKKFLCYRSSEDRPAASTASAASILP